MRPADDALRSILEAGLRAPSAENRHYLRFAVQADRVELRTTDRPTWQEQPHRKMLALLAYGAVIENMALRSGVLGLEMACRLASDPSASDLIAELQWQEPRQPPRPDPLAQAISHRHTNRRLYRPGKLGDAVLGALTTAASQVAGARVIWLDGRAERRQALQAIRIAEAERFRGRRLHAEMFEAVRFERGWKKSTEEGLPLSALEVDVPMRPALALLSRWGPMSAASRVGLHHLLGVRSGYLPSRSASHLGLIAMEGVSGDAANVGAGRAMERLWLAASVAGVALQPMAAVTALLRQIPGDGWVRPAVQARLQGLLASLSQGCTGFMLLRVGRAGPATGITARRPVDAYLDVS